jgi:hypothetical protein
MRASRICNTGFVDLSFTSTIVASATCGMHKTDWYVGRLLRGIIFLNSVQGPERVKNLYAFRSLVDSGARIALGSDFPVESPNPLSGFYAAITRLSADGTSPHGPGGWYVRPHFDSAIIYSIP